MGVTSKKQGASWSNTAGRRAGMKKGNAPAPGKPGGPSRGHIHDAGFSYAEYAKSDPGTGKK